MTIGDGELRYKLVRDWGRLPDGLTFDKVSGMAVDSRDRVYLFARTKDPVIVLEADGSFVTTWGQGVFTRAHGIYIDRHDRVFCADDKDHTVREFTTGGTLVRTWGTPGRGSDTGYDGKNPETVLRGGAPFNRPTGVCFDSAGEMFVTDGYGNARVHRFDTEGQLAVSWGEPGDGPGEFHSPHCLRVAKNGQVYVVDKENSRIQVFTRDGQHIANWSGVNRPNDILIDEMDRIHVIESPGQITVFSLGGEVLARWGKNDPQAEPGEDLQRAHTIAMDSTGAIYVAGCAHDYVSKYEPVSQQAGLQRAA